MIGLPTRRALATLPLVRRPAETDPTPAGEAPDPAAPAEPLHRLASRTATASAGAGLLGGATLGAIALASSGPRADQPVVALLAAVVAAAFVAVLLVVEAPIRRAPRWLRLPLLPLAAVPAVALVIAAPVWFRGLVQGGPERGLQEVADNLTQIHAPLLLLGIATLPLVVLGGARVVLPEARTALRRALRHAAAGGLAGALVAGAALLELTGGSDLGSHRDALTSLALMFVAATSAAGLGLHLGELLEARLARALARRDA